MDSQSFPVYLKQGVRAFALRFNNPYHFKLFKAQVTQMGYTIKEVGPSDEVDSKGKPKWDSAAVMLEQATRASLFQKVFYFAPYDAEVWPKLKKAKLSSPCVMYTESAQVKSAEDWEGPTDAQIVGEMEARINSMGIRYNPDAWKMLLDAYRDKENRITDPVALWNMVYSIAVQSEGIVDAGLVRGNIGFKAQIYDLLNVLMTKNVRGSLQAMHILVNEESVIGLCMGLEKMLCEKLGVYESYEKGESSDAYAARMGVHPYKAKMMFKQILAIQKVNLIRLTEALLKADLLMKSTRSVSKSETFKHEMMKYLDL